MAGFQAGFAGSGALFAVSMRMLDALVVALLADFDALLQHVRGVVGAAGDEGGGETADVGAVAVEADAGYHYFDVGLAQAGGGAVLAGGCAAGEGVEHILVGGARGSGNGHELGEE